MKSTSTGAKGLDNLLGSLNIGALAAAAGVKVLVDNVINFGKASLQAFAEFESVKMNLEVVMGSAEKASATFDQLKALASKTPFSVNGLADASTQLLQTGTHASELTKVLTMLGDVAGGSQEKFNRIVANYAQIQSTGMTTSMDIKQFASAGLPIYDTLEKLGIKGNATAEQLKQAFEIMTQEGGAFFNGMEKMSTTLNGKISTLKDTWQEFLVTVAESTGLGDTMKWLADEATKQLGIANTVLSGNTLNDKAKRVKNGTATAEEQVEVRRYWVEELEKEVAEIEEMYALLGGQFSLTNEEYNKLFSTKDQLAHQKEMIAIFEAQIEKTKELQEATAQYQKQFDSFDKVKSDIAFNYAETDEGKKSDIEKQIEMWEKRKNSTRKVRNVINSSTGEYRESVEFLSDEEKRQIDVIIADLKAQLGGETAKEIEKTWQEVFKEITGVAVNFGETGGQVAKRFVENMNMDTNEERILEALGLTPDNATKLQQNADEIQKVIISLLDSGKFSMEDNSINELIDSYERVAKEAEEAQKLKTSSEVLNNLETENELLAEQLDLLIQGNANRRGQELSNQGVIANTSTSVKDLQRFKDMQELRKQGVVDGDMNKALAQKQAQRQKENDIAYKTEMIYLEEMLNLQTQLTNEADLRRILEGEITEKQIEQQNAQRTKLNRELQINQYEANMKQENYTDYATRTSSAYQKEILEYQKLGGRGFDTFKDAVNQFKSGTMSFGDAVDVIKNSFNTSNLGDFAKASAQDKIQGAIQGSELGTFVNTTMQTGDPLAGLVDALLMALVNVVGGIEGIQEILNPFSAILQEFAPLIKALLVPVRFVIQMLGKLAQMIMKVLNIVTFGLIEAGANYYDSLVQVNSETKVQIDNTQKINDQYNSLLRSMKENEDYYLKKRREFNADFINQQISAGLSTSTTSVNDMILTPNGTFSTAPDDYIIAMKKPEKLMGENTGGTVVAVTVNNNAGESVQVEAKEQKNDKGFAEVVIDISRKIAQDYASGSNGWESALTQRSRRQAGRSLS